MLALFVLSCSNNHPPVIESMFSVPELVHPGDTVELHGAATDLDGDELTMNWFFHGIPLASGIWQSPDNPGDFYVHLRVTDQIDMVEDSLLIQVRGQSLFRDSRDGNGYRYVTIGSQIWMAENLAYLPSVGFSARGSNTEPRYFVCGYKGTDVNEAKKSVLYQNYGTLYNWAAAKIACPAGWHLPTDEEWKVLEKYLGMSTTDIDGFDYRISGEVGHQLREAGTTHWNSPNTGSTNSTGFTALPAGEMAYNIGYTGFTDFGGAAYFWTATPYKLVGGWIRFLYNSFPGMDRHYLGGSDGISVRCVKDE
jgi:uncharacterized protein (TIGR02145 family)